MRKVLLMLAAVAFAFGGAHAFTLTVSQGSDIVTLDPHRTNDQPSARVMRQVYDTLVIQTEELELLPGLAVSWTQLDEATWDFELRSGVTFHNGDPLTASDVAFSLNRLLDPATGAPGRFVVSRITSVEAVDDMTVRIITDGPFAPLLAHLSHNVASILSESVVTAAGEDYGTRVVVGTGPFEFVSWEVQSQLVLDRFEAYWGETALAERVVFRPITEGTVRAIELEAGAIDIAYDLEPRDALRMENRPDVVMAPVTLLSMQYVGFNAQKEPFDDVRVRQAINHAVDAETIVDVIYEGFGFPSAGPIGPNVFGYNDDLEPYAFDPERARQLLDEAGLGGGFSTVIWTNDNPLRIQIAEIMQAQLAEVGVSADIQVLEWSTYLDDTAAGLHDMFILGWGTVTADADYGLYALFHSSQFGSPGNRSFWGDDRVDELLDAGRRTIDPDERLAIYAEAQELIVEGAPWLFLNTSIANNATRDTISGFVPHPTGSHFLRGVSKN